MGPLPLCGVTESHEAPGVADHANVPLPPFATPRFCWAGSGPPTDPVNVRLVGLTRRTGDDAVLPYAERGPSLYALPVVHVPGSVVSDVCELVSAAVPVLQQRSRKAIAPPEESSAIQ